MMISKSQNQFATKNSKEKLLGKSLLMLLINKGFDGKLLIGDAEGVFLSTNTALQKYGITFQTVPR